MFGIFVVEIHPTAVIKNLHLNISSFFVFKIHELSSSTNVAEITSVLSCISSFKEYLLDT